MPVNVVFNIVDSIISSMAGIDKVEVIDKGDRVVKVYMVRRFKTPWAITKALMYIKESVIPPLRDPRSIKIEYYTKAEEGVFSEDDIIVVSVPKTTKITETVLSRVREPITHNPNVTIGEALQKKIFGREIGIISSPYRDMYEEK